MTAQVLSGAHILLVEDEPFIAIDFESAFEGHGCQVTTATSCAEALRILETGAIDAAVVDFLLEGELCTPVIEELGRRGKPFVVVSGAARVISGVPWMLKPTSSDDVIAALSEAWSRDFAGAGD